jgi:hypothetical protein
MYSAYTGQYVLSIVNGTSLRGMCEDENGHIYGYRTNRTAGTMFTYNGVGEKLNTK